MKTLFGAFALVAGTVLGGTAWAVDTPLGETASPFLYTLDSVRPVAEKDASDLTVTLWREEGDKVVAMAPDGTEREVVSTIWTPTAGGLWTLRRTGRGGSYDTALFTVRYGLFGTQGAGTEASPAKIVDADELIDDEAGAGYVFTLVGADDLLAALRVPDGLQLAPSGNGLWRLVRAVPGWLAECLPINYALDSEAEGPNRRTMTSQVHGIAYTGDSWEGNASASSTLTFVSPSGETSVRNLAGTGVDPMRFRQAGFWHVTLAYAGATLDAEITVLPDATAVFIR